MTDHPENSDFPSSEKIPLSRAIQIVLEECRMVLPGLQALFGFQLVAVVEPPFFTLFTPSQQLLSLLALGLLAISMGLLMAPAASQRQIVPESASRDFLKFAARCLTLGMAPLMFAISIDFYLVAIAILKVWWIAAALTACLLVFLASLWFILPYLRSRKLR